MFDEGGEYDPAPSKIHTYLNGIWDACLSRIDNARGDRLGILLNGDLTEGDHHGTVQMVSKHPHVEFAILKDLLEGVVRLKPDFVVVTRGTSAHVGKAGHKDEAAAHYLAKECGLNVVRCPDTGKYSHWLARLSLQGKLIWATHHGTTGRVAWSNMVSNAALQVYVEQATAGRRPPDLVIRAHNHKFADSYGKHPTRLVHQGAFQLATEHVHKVVPAAIANIGGLIVQCRRDRPIDVEEMRYVPDEPPAWSDDDDGSGTTRGNRSARRPTTPRHREKP